MGQRARVFAVALLVRGGIAFVFFGSVDVTNAILDAERLLRGALPSSLNVPYLPGVQALVWAAGVLSFHGWIPITFFYKLFGCLFDSAIAAMLVDARDSRAGWLYAFAPVPLFIVAIHGQWDSISLALFLGALLLLRRPGIRPAAAAGMLYVLSVIVKPLALPFIVFFFPAPWLWRQEAERKRVIAILAGITATLALYVLTLRALGDPLNYRTIEHILDYARGGVTYLGLPHALGVGQNRMLLLLPILILLLLHWRGRIGRETAILLGYTFILGTAGLSAQYLVWLVPFLLLRGHDRFLALYSVLAGIFLTFFYTTPGIGAIRFENLAAMAPLRPLSWLTPAFSQIETKTWAIAIVGNILLPLSCLAFLANMAWRRAPEADAEPPASTRPLWVAGALTGLLIITALALPRPAADAFVTRTHPKAAAYDMNRMTIPGEPKWAIRSYGAAHWQRRPDASDLALLWIVVWSGVAFRGRANQRSWPGRPKR